MLACKVRKWKAEKAREMDECKRKGEQLLPQSSDVLICRLMQTSQTSVMLTLPFSFPGSLQWYLQVCCPIYCDLFKASVGWFPVPYELKNTEPV